jgi:hypothetical protein
MADEILRQNGGSAFVEVRYVARQWCESILVRSMSRTVSRTQGVMDGFS